MEDMVWRKKSTSVFRYFMLFGIRLSEVLVASIIPSVIGLVIVTITPKTGIMLVMENLSLIAFAALNAIFWVRYVKHRENRGEFYIMNGIVYLLYSSLSVITYIQKDAYLYSVLFSDLRGFEIIGLSTLQSMIVSHILLVLIMVISEIIARPLYIRRAMKDAENRGLDAEIEREELKPEKANAAVSFMTVDEVNLEIDREIAEAAKTIEAASQRTTDKNWDSEMVQGENGEVIETEPIDPDNDIDSSDYVSEEYAREEMSETMNYSPDALWNAEIYNGKERILDYDDEEYDTEMFVENKEFWGEDIEIDYDAIEDDETFDDNAWSDDEDIAIDYDDESDEYFSNSFEDYDSDNLWGEIKQGK